MLRKAGMGEEHKEVGGMVYMKQVVSLEHFQGSAAHKDDGFGCAGTIDECSKAHDGQIEQVHGSTVPENLRACPVEWALVTLG